MVYDEGKMRNMFRKLVRDCLCLNSFNVRILVSGMICSAWLQTEGFLDLSAQKHSLFGLISETLSQPR